MSSRFPAPIAWCLAAAEIALAAAAIALTADGVLAQRLCVLHPRAPGGEQIREGVREGSPAWMWEKGHRSTGRDGAWAGTRDDAHDDHDPRYLWYDLEHVVLQMDIDVAAERISGVVDYHLMATDDCPEVLLDLMNTLAVTAVSRDGAALPYTHEASLLRISLDPPLRLGQEAWLQVRYEGAPQPDGFQGLTFDVHPYPEPPPAYPEPREPPPAYPEPPLGLRPSPLVSREDPPPQPIISTLSEPRSARSWWPCKEVTYDKFTLETYFTLPDSLIAAGNGVLAGVLPAGDGRATWHWTETYPIATYLVSLAATNYATWEDVYVPESGAPPMPVVYYAYPEHESQARAAWERTPEMIAALARLFGEYPFLREKYGMAEFPWIGAMEHQTISSMGSYFLQYDVPSNERVVVHELAHQWWGDAVTPGTWKDLWLNEGFAVYCEALWQEYLEGTARYLTYMQDLDYPPEWEFEGPVYDPTYLFNPTVYNKGAWVLHMLRRQVGSELFFRALREYRQRFQYGSATTAVLQEEMERYSQADLDHFFQSWVYSAGRPFYTLDWTYYGPVGAGDLSFRITQHQEGVVFPMDLEIVCEYRNGATDTLRIQNDQRVQDYTARLPQEPRRLHLDPRGWVLKRVVGTYGPTAISGPPEAAIEGAAPWRMDLVGPQPSRGPVRVLLRPSQDDRLARGANRRPGGVSEPPRLLVIDAAGRRVASLEARREGSDLVATWEGTARSGGDSGVFWIRALGPCHPPACKVLRVR